MRGGRITNRIVLILVKRVTKLAFGGPDFSTGYLTERRSAHFLSS